MIARMLSAMIFFVALSATALGQSRRIDSLREVLNVLPDDTSRVKALDRYATALQEIDPRAALPNAQAAFRLAERLGWEEGSAGALNTIGSCYFLLASMDSARDAYEAALARNESNGNRRKAAHNLGNLGILSYQESDLAGALAFLFRALHNFEELGDRQGIVTQLGNIGNIYQQQSNFRAALHYDSLALTLYKQMGNRSGEAMTLGNIGNAYDALGQSRLAIASDQRAIALYERLGNPHGIARNLGNMSDSYARLGDETNTYLCLRRGMALMASVGDQVGLGTSNLNFGLFYLRRFKSAAPPKVIADVPVDRRRCLDSAMMYVRTAVAIHDTVGVLAGSVNSYGTLSKVYEAAGDYKAALVAAHRFKQLSDSVLSMDNKIRIKALETQRALDLKDKQIELDRLAVAKKRNERGFFIAGLLLMIGVAGIVFRNLRQQRRLNGQLSVEKRTVEQRTAELDLANSELTGTLEHLRETQSQLVIAEKQKEAEIIRRRVSQDIHDDISSELTRISWVSELAMAKARSSDYSAMPGLLAKISHASRETVTKLGEIIWTVNPANDSLESLLSYMRSHTTAFLADTGFRHQVNFPDTGLQHVLHPELKRNLFLVLKEALNNAVKYSSGTLITVSLEIRDRDYEFEIVDNGVGMRTGAIGGGGNGLANMRFRMTQVGGHCGIGPAREGSGTKVSFSGRFF